MWNKRLIKINLIISIFKLQFLNFYTLKCQLLHLNWGGFCITEGDILRHYMQTHLRKNTLL